MNQNQSSFRYSVGDAVQNFVLVKRAQIPDMALTVYEWQHPIGSKLLFLDKKDDNKVFSVSFRTTPKDSTGVAHILEHIVLCGSKKFPVRDPFFSMLKRSLQNFMNAFTASDWTMYPFATSNPTDYFNLMSVYLDAAFFPLLRENSFFQEGWRLEQSDREVWNSPLTAKGVVFNEMKGAMSSVNEIVVRKTMEALFPSCTYHYNSGGEPTEILQLSWENLKEFHRQHYHPCNAWFYLYGKVDFEQSIEKIEQTLAQFQPIVVDTKVYPEKRYTENQRFSYPIPVDPATSGSTSGEHHFLMAWLLVPIQDSLEVLLFKILNQILLGSSGSPLRKALIESGLGKRLADGSGYESEVMETFFVVGLQGVEPGNVAKVEALITDSLQAIIEQGIAPELIESSLHQLELEVRELDSSSYGEGLKTLLRFFTTWLHEGDYLYVLDFDKQIAALRAKLQEERVFENLMQKYFFDNPHCARITFEPDENFYDKQKSTIQRRIQQKAKTLDRASKERLLKKSLDLEVEQNTKEDLSLLPKVEVSEINPAKIRVDKNSVRGLPFAQSKTPVVYYRQNTMGLTYISLYFALPALSEEQRLLLPTLGMLLVGAGTKTTPYEEMALKIFRYTGGVSAQPYIFPSNPFVSQIPLEGFQLQGKALNGNIDSLLAVLQELVFDVSFHDTKRVNNLLNQRSDALYHSVLSSGHSYAGSLALRHLNVVAAVEELYSGVGQIKFSRKLNRLHNQEPSKIQQILDLAQYIFQHSKPVVVCVAEEKMEQELYPKLERLSNAFSANGASFDCSYTLEPKRSWEIWTMDTPVSYVAKAFSVNSWQHEHAYAMQVMATLIRGEFLHRAIREQGGAYGSMAGYDPLKGTFLLLSYRDPNLSKTWQNFDEAFRWVAQGRFSQAELDSAKLQVFAAQDRPMSPAKRAFQDFQWYWQGVQQEHQEHYRKQMLACSKELVVQTARLWSMDNSVSTAISSVEIWEQNRAITENANRYQLFAVSDLD